MTPKPPIKPDEDVRQQKTQLNALKSCKKWLIVGHTVLYESDRAVLLYEHEWVKDNHVSSAKILLKQQFPQLGGLQLTLKQYSRSLTLSLQR